MIVRDYAAYYSEPSIANAERLWESISEYDFTDYSAVVTELACLRRQTKILRSLTELPLKSNGSSANPRSFDFGPHGLFWLRKIEHATKSPILNILSLGCSFLHPPSFYRFLTYTHNSEVVPVKYEFAMRVTRPDLLSKLRQIIDELPDDKVVFSSNPSVLLTLTSQAEFGDLLVAKAESLQTTGWEPFFKKRDLIQRGVHINDNCVNWTTTLNFWTCRFNTRHFLPTFIMEENGIVNLLNLGGPPDYPLDDLMVMSLERVKCKCGRWYLPFSMVPHIDFAMRSRDGRVIYDDSIPESLDSIYHNLQFVSTSSGVDVLHCSEGISSHDEEWLRAFFGAYDLPVVFRSKRYSMCGQGKLIPFWGKPHRYCPLNYPML